MYYSSPLNLEIINSLIHYYSRILTLATQLIQYTLRPLIFMYLNSFLKVCLQGIREAFKKKTIFFVTNVTLWGGVGAGPCHKKKHSLKIIRGQSKYDICHKKCFFFEGFPNVGGCALWEYLKYKQPKVTVLTSPALPHIFTKNNNFITSYFHLSPGQDWKKNQKLKNFFFWA